ncbi:unnamed protein product [Leptidea sinapis]|uniref:alkaline phosphatase n=1 Tax=Leptidea sinapis TaxID=189913 RepID=A0A5E4Q6D7_9NEOP|nr:unnamed protein product [Leptidea sinapis]
MYPRASVLLWCAWATLAGGARGEWGEGYHERGGERAGGAGGRPAPDAAELTAAYWRQEAQDAIEERLRYGAGEGRARNVVMFLGDGMSVPTLAAARTLLGQRNRRPGEETKLSFEKFPTVGLSKTYCVDQQIADSACSASAYLCGAKANEGTIGVSAAVRLRDCAGSLEAANRLESIAAWAVRGGQDAGLVTTTRVTHASPAGSFARAAHRDWENDAAVAAAGWDPAVCRDIAHQLVHEEPGARFKVILGGGRREFLQTYETDEEGTAGRRTDGRNLITEWQDDKKSRNASFQYVWNREQLMAARSDPPEYLLGLFEGSHMQYHLQANNQTEPTLAEMTEVAIRMLKRNEKGFFLFVESGRIDHAHHDNYAELALDETIAMSDAVQRAVELLDEEDSLVVVTADHAHVMAHNGYTARGSNILGASDERDRNGVPYMTLSYINGPGHRNEVNELRVDVTQETNFGELEWRSHVEVPLSSETHGGDDVAVFAWGAQHNMFSGLYEQSQLPHRMGYASCLGPGRHAAACSTASPRDSRAALTLTLAAAAVSLLLRSLSLSN